MKYNLQLSDGSYGLKFNILLIPMRANTLRSQKQVEEVRIYMLDIGNMDKTLPDKKNRHHGRHLEFHSNNLNVKGFI